MASFNTFEFPRYEGIILGGVAGLDPQSLVLLRDMQYDQTLIIIEQAFHFNIVEIYFIERI